MNPPQATELLDRRLRFDGVSEITPEQLPRFLLLGVPPSKLRVTEETDDVRSLNEQVLDEDRVLVVDDMPVRLDLSWQLPEKYVKLDLDEYFAAKYYEVESNYTVGLRVQVLDRIANELEEVKRRDLTQFMRTVIFILDELRRHGVVWGVGRGSSCASYLLFLAGLHVVDCVTMNVPLDEFYHD